MFNISLFQCVLIDVDANIVYDYKKSKVIEALKSKSNKKKKVVSPGNKNIMNQNYITQNYVQV